MRFTLRYRSVDSKLILDGGDPVALAMECTNGRWSLCDLNEMSLSKHTYDKPKDVKAAWAHLAARASLAEAVTS